MTRTCATCGHRVRAVNGRWVHSMLRHLDTDHRAALGSPGSAPLPPHDLDVVCPIPAPPAKRVTRKPRRTIVPLPEPVRWGRQQPIEKRAFDAETTRRRGCEVAAGIPLLGEL